MKTRILSLLLLVVMVMTAVPLVAFPSFATEEATEYTAEDYNALYVQSGLMFAVDFFATNKYWGETATGTSLANKGYDWKTTGSHTLYGTAVPADGKIAFGGTSGWSASINAWPTTKFTSSMTQEFVGIFRATANPLFSMLGVDLRVSDYTSVCEAVSVMAGGNLLTTNGGGRLDASIGTKITLPASYASTTAFRLTKSSTTALEDGYFGFFVDGSSKYDNPAVKYPAITNTDPALGVSVTTGTRDLYASRIYTRLLSETELAQNRFADLAKWFKIDLSLFNMLSDAQKATLYADPDLYTLRFEDDTVGATLERKIAALAAEQYGGLLTADAMMLVSAYGLDLSILDAMPYSSLSNTLTFLNNGGNGADDVVAAYEAALAADLAAVTKYEAATYNQFYDQTGLYFAADFFTTNSYWGGESYTGALADGGFAWKTEQGTAFSGNATVADGKVNLMGAAENLTVTGTYSAYTKNGYKDSGELLAILRSKSGSFTSPIWSSVAIHLDFNNYNVDTGKTDLYFGYRDMHFKKGTSDYYSIWGFAAPTTATSYVMAFKNSSAPANADGSFYFYVNGAKKTGNDQAYFQYGLNSQNTVVRAKAATTGETREVYALRHYDHIISTDTMKQNRFADILKWYRVDLTYLLLLDDETVASFYADAYTYSFTDASVKTTLEARFKELYAEQQAAKHVDGKDAYNAFLDLQVNYPLDTTELTSSARDLSEVYNLVTLAALVGKDLEGAQEVFDAACDAAYYYYSYAKTDATEWNEFLGKLATAGISTEVTESLMALPFAERQGAITLDPLNEDALAEYVADEMAKYASYVTTAPTAADYNALYVQNGLYFAADFFTTNSYWGGDAYSGTLKDGDFTWKTISSSSVFLSGTATVADGKINLMNTANSLGINGTGYYFKNVHKNDTSEVLAVLRSTSANFGASVWMPCGLQVHVPAFNTSTGKVDLQFGIAWNHVKTAGGDYFSQWGVTSPATPATFVVGLGVATDANTADGYFSFRINKSQIFAAAAQFTGGVPASDTTFTSKAATEGETREVYALRNYSRLLDATELAQNRFADLAKWFRLDLSYFNMLSDEQKAALYADASLYSIAFDDPTGKETLGALVASYVTMYDDAEGKLDADFLAFAEANALDITTLASILEDESRAKVVNTIYAEFPAGYACNSAVVASMLDRALAFLNSLSFMGLQVRIDRPGTERMPGVRALFAIGEDALADLLASTDEVVTFGAYITIDGVRKATVIFTPTAEAGSITYTGENLLGETKLSDAVTTKVDGQLAFAYTVTYQSFEDAEFDRTVYDAQFNYEFFVGVGDTTYTRAATYNHEDFKDGVSATEAYRYFYDKEMYTDDAMLGHVLNITPTPEVTE